MGASGIIHVTSLCRFASLCCVGFFHPAKKYIPEVMSIADMENAGENPRKSQTKQQTCALCTGCRACLIPASYWESISSVQFNI